MAEAIARDEILRAGYGEVEVSSAGVAALIGYAATYEAELVAAENGLTLAGHQARQVTRELLDDVDLVVGMRHEHAEYARRLGARRVTTLSTPIHDPYARGVAAYRE